MEKHKRRSLLAKVLTPAVAGLTLLSLAACGAPSTASGAAGASEGKTSIKVVVAPIQFETAYIAKEKGFFDEAGLSVEIVPGADPSANLAQTVSGQAGHHHGILGRHDHSHGEGHAGEGDLRKRRR